jgi:hypothetical protein
VSAELIYRRGTALDAEYTFKHSLVQDAAHATLRRGSRQQLHRRIAETLERLCITPGFGFWSAAEVCKVFIGCRPRCGWHDSLAAESLLKT